MKLQRVTLFAVAMSLCVFLIGAPNSLAAQVLDSCRAHAVCSVDSSGDWLCDGPLQEVFFGSNKVETALQESGCIDAQEVGSKDSWTIFMCADEPGERDILNKYDISQSPQSCDDGQEAAAPKASPGSLGQVSQQEMDEIRQTADRVNKQYEEKERRQQQAELEAEQQAAARQQSRNAEREQQRRDQQLLEQRLLDEQRREQQESPANDSATQGGKSDVMKAVEEIQRQIEEQQGGGSRYGADSGDESEMVRKALEEVMRKAEEEKASPAPADSILLEETEEPKEPKETEEAEEPKQTEEAEEPKETEEVEEVAKVEQSKGFSLTGKWRRTDSKRGELSVLAGGRATYIHPETAAMSGEWEKLPDNQYNIIWSRNPDGSPFSWEAINVIDRNLISVTNETRSTDGFQRTLATFHYLRVQD